MDRGDVPATRVFLVDSRELLRLGIASLLSVQAEFEVVGEAARAVDVLPRVRATRPDVVLVGELSSDRPAAHDGAGAAGAGAGAAGVGAAAAMATAATAAAVAGLCRELRSEPEPPVCLLLTGGRDDRALA
ncbi:MAG TPA: hypothetical protein VH372_21990, partial [Actinospica sp.]|nr:hypothetical protein [Actinospica sp.]